MPHKDTMTEWICTACGKKERKSIILGRPQPGCCSKALRRGGPHRWVKNRNL